LQRAVAHVARLLAEDRAEELLLGRELGLALRRDLPDEDVARLHLGADAHDAGLVEVLEGLFAHVGDVAGDLFLAELGVAGDALELLDVDRGEDVLLGDALGDEDRVLEVVALPGHERDDDVRAQRELAHVAGGAVGEHVAHFDLLAGRTMGFWFQQVLWLDRWYLVSVVDVRDLAAFALGAHHDAVGVDALDDAGRLAVTHTPESRATPALEPVPTSGAMVRISGTAWRCMLAPMSARFASSCSRKGTSAAATDTIWFGATSMSWTWSGVTILNSPLKRADTRDSVNRPLSSTSAVAWAMYFPSSWSAENQCTSSVTLPPATWR
jgi:hypothetical protein